jgi:Co/Zn/Cd efflux system component
MNRYRSLITRRHVADFYRRQEKLQREFESDRTVASLSADQFRIDDSADVDRRRRIDRRVSSTTLYLNLLLLIAKLIAAYLSNSLSITSTALDSAMDITSGLIVW